MILKRVWSLLVLATAAAVALPVLADVVPPGSEDEIRTRLEPFGGVCRSGEDCGAASATVASGPLSGEEVYNQFCFACHATGASGAPLYADATAWAPRIDKGMEALMSSTLNGIGVMPAKGTCMNCSDEELQAAVEYMVEPVQ